MSAWFAAEVQRRKGIRVPRTARSWWLMVVMCWLVPWGLFVTVLSAAKYTPGIITIFLIAYAVLQAVYINLAHDHINLVTTGGVKGSLYAMTTGGRLVKLPITPWPAHYPLDGTFVDQPRRDVCVLRGATLVYDAT